MLARQYLLIRTAKYFVMVDVNYDLNIKVSKISAKKYKKELH